MTFRAAGFVFLVTASLGLHSTDSLSQDKPADVNRVGRAYGNVVLTNFGFQHGVLPGRLVTETKNEEGRPQVVIETPSGVFLKLEKGRIVKRVDTPTEQDGAYQKRLARVNPESAADHWAMYEWIQEQDGKSRFAKQRDFHLRRIIAIEPSDEKAHRMLGHRELDGQWIHPDHKFSSHGYVKMTGGWVPELQRDVLLASGNQEATANGQKASFKKWQRMIGKVAPNILQRELNSIASPNTVEVIFEKAQKERDLGIRMTYLEALGTVNSSQAQDALVFFAIRDGNRAIRDRAITLLKTGPYNQDAVASWICRTYLTSQNNDDVLQSGYVLGELGVKSAILPMISALSTVHVSSPKTDPRRIESTFDNQGTFNFGNKQPKATEELKDNQTVREALRRISGRDFGFDKASWRAWYSSEYTINQIDLRADD